MGKLLGMCFDWRVLGGLAAVGLGIWLYAPQMLGAALPLLFVLICPLSMVVMALLMRGSMGTPGSQPSAADRLAALEQEQMRLNAELAALPRPVERAKG